MIQVMGLSAYSNYLKKIQQKIKKIIKSFFLCIICIMIHFHEGIIGNASLLELISNFYLDLDFIIGFPLFFFNVQELIF